MRYNPSLIFVTFAVIGVGMPGAAVASTAAQIPCRYDVTVIQGPLCPPFGDPPVTTVTGLNERGHVCGYRWQCPPTDQYDEAFVWMPETGMVTIPRPPGVVSAQAADINDNGVVVGTCIRSGAGNRAFVYDHGVWTELSPPFPQGSSSAAAINNAGLVCGRRSIGPAFTPYNAFIWNAKDGFTDLGIINEISSASAINQEGAVVGRTGPFALPGEQGFLWTDGRAQILPRPPGSLFYTASSINNAGLILGGATYPQTQPGETFGRAIRWERETIVTLEPLPGYLSSGSFDINDDGVVVGRSINSGFGAPGVGTVWFNDSPRLLSDLIESTGVIDRGQRINDDGLILARGSAGGWPVGFLLTPMSGGVADLNGDCAVNSIDLGVLLVNWSIPSTNPGCQGAPECPADLNHDGFVNSLDLGMMLVNWTFK